MHLVAPSRTHTRTPTTSVRRDWVRPRSPCSLARMHVHVHVRLMRKYLRPLAGMRMYMHMFVCACGCVHVHPLISPHSPSRPRRLPIAAALAFTTPSLAASLVA